MQNDELAEALIPLVNSTAFQVMMRDPRGSLGKPEDAIAAAVRAYANREDVVERVARAIAASKRGLGERGDEIIDRVWTSYVGQSRAAINAMLGGGDAE